MVISSVSVDETASWFRVYCCAKGLSLSTQETYAYALSQLRGFLTESATLPLLLVKKA